MKYEKQFATWYSKDHDEPCAFNNKDECRAAWLAAEQFFIPMIEEAEHGFHRILKELKYGLHPSMQWTMAEIEEALDKIAKMKVE